MLLIIIVFWCLGTPAGGVKEEDGDSKRWHKAMSPGSMNLPTTHTYDMGQTMSPYVPPDMNSESKLFVVASKVNIKTHILLKLTK